MLTGTQPVGSGRQGPGRAGSCGARARAITGSGGRSPAVPSMGKPSAELGKLLLEPLDRPSGKQL